MEMITGAKPNFDITASGIAAAAASGLPVNIHGMVHVHRDMVETAK